jgi:hypothetical protein
MDRSGDGLDRRLHRYLLQASCLGEVSSLDTECAEVQPLTYLCFSSSFICSARSRPAPLLVFPASGVAPLDARAVTEGFVRLGAFFSAELGTMRGELAILQLTGEETSGMVVSAMSFLLKCSGLCQVTPSVSLALGVDLCSLG